MGVMGKRLVISIFFPLKVHIPHYFSLSLQCPIEGQL